MNLRQWYRSQAQQMTEGEHNQAVVRSTLVALGTMYGVWVTWGDDWAPVLYRWMVATNVLSMAFWMHAIWNPKPLVWRRALGVIHDIGATTIFLSFCGPAGALYIFVFPWNIIGNGFRYGLKFLAFSAVCAAAGMLYLIYFANLWAGQKVVGFGALISFILVAVYSAFLLHQRQKDAVLRDKVLIGLRDIVEESEDAKDKTARKAIDNTLIKPLIKPLGVAASAKLNSQELLRLTKEVNDLVVSKQERFRDLEIVFQGNLRLSQSRTWNTMRDSIRSLVSEIILGLPDMQPEDLGPIQVWIHSDENSTTNSFEQITEAGLDTGTKKIRSDFTEGLALEIRRTEKENLIMLVYLPKVSLAPKARDPFDRLWTALSPSLVSAYDLIQFISEVREKGRLENELKTAQLVQQTLLPKMTEQVRGIQISSYFQSANECGGDWWGFYPVSGERQLILVGDATGHGTASALVTAILKGFADAATLTPDFDLAAFFHNFNGCLFEAGQGQNCLSMLGLVVDLKAKTVEVMNAGHPPPILIARTQWDIQVLHAPPAQILGFDPELPECCTARVYPLPDHSQLIAYTDGLTEALDVKNRLFGEGRVLRLLKQLEAKSDHLSEDQIRDVLQTQFETWLGGRPAQDDTTFLVVDLKPQLQIDSRPLRAG